jgi:hypothetical protein
VGPTAGIDAVEKREVLNDSRNRNLAVQPVAVDIPTVLFRLLI